MKYDIIIIETLHLNRTVSHISAFVSNGSEELENLINTMLTKNEVEYSIYLKSLSSMHMFEVKGIANNGTGLTIILQRPRESLQNILDEFSS